MSARHNINPVPLLKLVNIVRSLRSKYGNEVLKIIEKGINNIPSDNKNGNNIKTAKGLAAYIKSEEFSDINLEIIKCTNDRLHIFVHKCPVADSYSEIAACDIGYILSCKRDCPLAGKNTDKTEFEIKKSLLKGDECCELKWKLNSKFASCTNNHNVKD